MEDVINVFDTDDLFSNATLNLGIVFKMNQAEIEELSRFIREHHLKVVYHKVSATDRLWIRSGGVPDE